MVLQWQDYIVRLINCTILILFVIILTEVSQSVKFVITSGHLVEKYPEAEFIPLLDFCLD